MSEYNNINPFESYSGSLNISKPGNLIMLFSIMSISALIIVKLGVIGIGLLLAVIFGSVFLYYLFCNPVIGYYTAIALNFVIIGMGRYVKGLPLGFAIDGILVLTYLALFMNQFRTRIDWTPAKRDITFLSILWLGYSVFELVNPEARSVQAWISGRGIAFYPFLFIPLTFMFIRNEKRLSYFFYIWAAFSLLATLKGIMQMTLGVDGAEQEWLNEGSYKTHILFGKLRVFSFYSDAGQFGANQGYTGVVFLIYAMSQQTKLKKIFFIFVGLLGIYGMVISGTRGALSVPIVGFMTYFILSKNVKVIIIGVTFLAIVFIFFKYTTIAQGNAQVRRMRTAFDPNDASLQVRLDNQKILKNYLASRPFGGGIGHGGTKAQKYLPNAFLSNVATDSWYVLIWVEQGIVGLILHLVILFYVMIKASLKVMFKIRDPILKFKMASLIAGMAGIMVASYGNAVLGQMPTALLIYATMAIILNSDVYEKEIEENQAELLKQ
ncbi:O-antigen ligase family protein [Flavobacterium sp. HJJ]|uniref:O-antigen ligase family protein n=1 Tax=Flavobacterium sp. HJJ TaxID=2783792 RepID=UPI00188BC31A|nr:O-antigen ligase family protein [Flavobacterium sp. HJJ]MBF4470579.1 O-antigen ligase family protein [Flavobacterium sp. HJJ]